jgi:hypothetical protein
MPATRNRQSTTRYRDRRCNDPNYETYIQDTLTEVATNQHSSLRQAARQTGVSEVIYNMSQKAYTRIDPKINAWRQGKGPS